LESVEQNGNHMLCPIHFFRNSEGFRDDEERGKGRIFMPQYLLSEIALMFMKIYNGGPYSF
jgi:hypothetical protein